MRLLLQVTLFEFLSPADATNGFNAVVKTQGPNVHPHDGEGDASHDHHHGHHHHNQDNHHGYPHHNSNSRNDYTVNYAHPALTYHNDDKSSQSKINHYSKNQEHIVLSSDLKQNDFLQDPIDLAGTVKKIPQLIELRPDALKVHNRKPTYSYDIDHHYSPNKRNQFADDGNYYNGGGGNQQTPEFVGNEYRPATQSGVQAQRHQYANYVPGSESDWRVKKPVNNPYPAKYPKPNYYPGKVQNAPKAPLMTPGLKYFASAKPSYNSYFNKRPQIVRPRNTNEGPVVFPAQDYETNEQRQASSQIVESMVRGNDQLFIVPIYANNHQQGRFRQNYQQ